MTALFDYTFVHIEDDVSSWRENPAKIHTMIRDLIPEEDKAKLKLSHPPDRYADCAITRIEFPRAQAIKRLQFISSTAIGVDGFEDKLKEGGELTFIVDARRPGSGDKMDFTLFESFESIAPFVEDSRMQVRVFTAYLDVEDQLSGMKKVKKKQLAGFHHPVEVIGKTDAYRLSMFLLYRLGFGA